MTILFSLSLLVAAIFPNAQRAKKEPPKLPAALYADARTRAAVMASLAAYAKLKDVEIRSVSSRGESILWLSKGRVRERQPLVEWTYVSRILTLRDRKSTRLYRGPAPFSDIPDYLARLHGSMDPISRKLIRRQSPLVELIKPAFGVRVAGSVLVAGNTQRIIQLRSAGIRISCWIRVRDSLVMRIETETRDARGNLVTRGARTFEYRNIGKPTAGSAFVLRGRARTLPNLGQ